MLRLGLGKPVWISFTPDDSDPVTKDVPRLRSGQSVEEVVQWTLSARPAALLFNCCRPEFIAPALDIATKHCTGKFECIEAGMPFRLGAYANAFVPRSDDYTANADVCPTDDALTPDAYATIASEWLNSEVNVVGGMLWYWPRTYTRAGGEVQTNVSRVIEEASAISKRNHD